jgi:hypothetical protein
MDGCGWRGMDVSEIESEREREPDGVVYGGGWIRDGCEMGVNGCEVDGDGG